MSRDNVRGYGAAYKLSTDGPSDAVQLAAANFIGGRTDKPCEKLKAGDKVATHDELHWGFIKESNGPRVIVQWGFMDQGQFWTTKRETLLASHLKKVDRFPNDKKASASKWMGSFLNIEERGAVNG